MAHPQHEELKLVLDNTRAAITAAKEIKGSAGDKIRADLSRVNVYITAIGSFSHDPELSNTRTFGEIVRDEVESLEEAQPASESELLQKEVDQIYPGFRDRSTDELLDTLTDLQIRGVARKAGLMWTEEEPERISTAEVELIKQEIFKKNNLEEITGTSQVANDNLAHYKQKLEQALVDKKALEEKHIPAFKEALTKAKGVEKIKKAEESLAKAEEELGAVNRWIEIYVDEIKAIEVGSGN